MPQIINGLPGKPITSFESQDRLSLPGVETLNKYDVNYYPELNQEQNRADNQTWLKQIGNGLVSRGLSIIPKIGAGVGSVGGAAVAIFNGDSSTIWDNPISNWFNEMDEGLRDMAPVYKSREYAKGDLWSKMLTTGFWADDAFDGIAYAASAMAPGTLIGKGINAGATALRSADVGKKIVEGLSIVGLNSHRASLLAATAYNTISEAAAEAYQTQQEIMAIYKDQGMPEQEAKVKAAKAASETFWANTAVLAIPNFMQSSFFHGSWDSVSKKVRDNIWNNKGVYDAAKDASSLWGEIGKSVASEGLWEENVQQGIQNYQKQFANKTLEGKDFVSSVASNMALNIKGFGKSFLPGVTTDSLEDEGAVAIFLGGLIGAGAAGIGHVRESKERRETADIETKRYANLFTGEVGKAALNIFQDNVSSLYKKNGKKIIKDGDRDIEVTDFATENGNLQMDDQALINITLGQLRNKKLWDAQMVSAYRNDPMMSEYNNKIALASMVHDIYTKGYSKEEASKYLDNLGNIGTNEAKETNVDTYIVDNISTAKRYLDVLDGIHTKNKSKEDFEKNPQEFKFKGFLNKINFYLEVKQDALQEFRNRDQTNQTINDLLEDNTNLLNEVTNNVSGVREEYLNTVNDVDNYLGTIAELKDKKNLTDEEQQKLNAANYKLKEWRHIEGDYALVDKATSSLPSALTPYQLSKIKHGSKDYYDAAFGKQQLTLLDAADQLAVGEDPVKIANNLANNLTYENERTDQIIHQTRNEINKEFMALDTEPVKSLETFVLDELLFSESEPDETLEQALGLSRLDELKDVLNEFGLTKDTQVKDVPVEAIKKELLPRIATMAKGIGDRMNELTSALDKLDTIGSKALDYMVDQHYYNTSDDKMKYLRDKYFKEFVKDRTNALISRFDNDKENFDDVSEVRSVLSLLNEARAAITEGANASWLDDNIEYIQKVIFPVILDNIKKQGAAQLQSNANLVDGITSLESIKDAKVLEAFSIAGSRNPASVDGILMAIQSLQGNKEFEDDLEKELNATLLEYESFLKNANLDSTTTPGTFKGSKYYAKSPNSYINIILQAGELKALYDNPSSRLYQFRFDQDLDRLVAEMKSHSEFSDSLQQKLIRIWQLHNTILSIKTVQDILGMSSSFSTLVEKKESIVGDIKPSLQQNIVLNSLMGFLSNKESSWALVKGIGGSGKTFVVARLLAKLMPSNIYAFSKTQKTSENINKAIFDNPPKSTFESFMALDDEQMKKIDLFIIDEAFTFTNSEIELIKSKINIFKNANPSSRIKVITLGDPSQTTAEESPILTSPMFTGLHVTPALTSTYRTNVGPISSVNNRFRLNNTEVNDAFGQANKSVEDILAAGVSDAVGVVVTKTEDEILDILAKPSSRSRVLIVNNDSEKASYSGSGYDVETPLSAQGYQWDEVYVLLDKPKLGNTNFEINKNIYTALSRAKSLIVTSPSIGIKSSLPNRDLVSSTDESSEQLKQASDFFEAVMQGARDVREFLQNGITTTVLPAIEEEPSEATGSEDIAAPTSYVAILPEDLAEDVIPVAPRIDDLDDVHSLAYPSNYPIASGNVDVNSTGHIVRILGSDGRPSYAIVAKSNVSPNYVVLGYLGNYDFDNNDYFATVINEKPTAQISYARVDKTANGFDIPNIDAVSLGQVSVDDYRRFKLEYTDNYDDSKSVIENTIIKFYHSFFGVGKSGRRVIPAEVRNGETIDPSKEWVINGEVNWSVVKNKISIQIFTHKNPPKDGTNVFYGLPYMVIKDPRQENGQDISRSIYIALDATKLNSSSHYYQRVKELYDTLVLIQDKSEQLVLGEPYLQEVANKYVEANYTVETTNDLLAGKTLAIKKSDTPTSLSELEPILGLSDSEFKELDALFDELAPLVYGIELKTTYFETKEEAEALVNTVIDGKKIVSVDETKNGKFYLKYAKDATDENITEVFQQYAVRSGQGTAQKALNAIAAANQGVGETNIRIKQSRGVVNGLEKFQLTSHSILSPKEFIDYQRLYKDFPQWGKTSVSFKSASHLLNWIENNPDKAGISRADVQALINTKYKTAPYNLNTLSRMLETDDEGNSVHLREPLRVGNLDPTVKNFEPGVNHKGTDLSNPDNREYLNAKLRTRFQSVRQTYVDIRLPKVGEAKKKRDENTFLLKDLLRTTGTFMDNITKAFFEDSNIKVIKKVIPGLGSTSGAAAVWNNVSKEYEIHINYEFDPKDLNAVSILLHEALHAKTSLAIHNVEHGIASKKEEEFVEEMTILQKRFNAVIARKGIKRADIYQGTLAEQSKRELIATAKKLGKKVEDLTENERLKPTATKINLREFVANLSNPKFYEIASQIEVKPKKTLLSSIIDALLKLVGLIPESSIYGVMMASVNKLLSTPRTQFELVNESKEQADKLLKKLSSQFEVELEEGKEYDEEDIVYTKYSQVFGRDGKVLDVFKQRSVGEQIEIINGLLINLDSTDVITSYALKDIPKEGLLSTGGTIVESHYLNDLIEDKLFISPVGDAYTYNIVYTLLHNELFDPYSRVVENYIAYKSDRKLLLGFLFNDVLSFQDKILLKDTVGVAEFNELEDYLFNNWDNIPLMNTFDKAGRILEDHKDDLSFILNSIQDNSVEAYREAKLYVINEIYKGMKMPSGLVKTKDEVIKAIIDRLKNATAEGVIRTEKRTLSLLAKELDVNDTPELRAKISKQRSRVFALQSLISKNQASGNMLFYDILADIYPKSNFKEIEDLLIYSDEKEGHIVNDREDKELEVSKGISMHIKEYNKSYELSMSDSLKTLLSFIKVNDRFVNGSVAYYKTLQYLTDLDTTQGLDKLMIQLRQLNSRNSLSLDDSAIVANLLNTISVSLDNTDLNFPTGVLPKSTSIVTQLSPSGVTLYYGIHTELELDVSNYSYEQANIAEDILMSPPFGNTTQLFNWLRSKNPSIEESTFNKMFSKAEAVNNVRELFNGMASMKETELYISTRSPRNKNKLALIRSKAAGVSFMNKEEMINRLQTINESQGINRFDELFKAQYPTAKSKMASANINDNIEGIKQFFSFMGLSSTTNDLSINEEDVKELVNAITSGFIKATDNVNLTDDFEGESNKFEDWIDNVDGYLTRFSDIISKGSSFVRNPSVRNSKGDKFFKFHESSWAYDTLLNLIKLDSSTKKFGGSKGDSKTRRVPDWIDTTFFHDNIFVKGDNKLYSIGEFEGALNTDNNAPTPYKRQNKFYFYHNYYLQFFMDGVRQYNDKYFQPVYIPSDKPKHTLVRVNVLNDTGEILSAIESALTQIVNRRKAKFKIVNFEKLSSKNEFRNFEIGAKAVKALGVELTEANIKQVAAKAHEILTEQASIVLDDIMKLELTFDIKRTNSTLSKVSNKVNPKYAFKSSKEDFFSKKRTDGKSTYTLTKNDLLPSFDLFYKNNYINGFFLNQMIAGDPSFYKSSEDIIKRYAGVFAPGVKGLVGDGIGMKETFRVLSLKDTEIPKQNTEDRLKHVIFDGREPNEVEQKEFDRLMSFFGDSYEVTDAQGFMTAERFFDIQKGFGRSWGTGYIMKPVHFELVKTEANGYSSATPIYLKYSSIVLEKSLIEKFPILKKLSDRMNALEVDELVFNSGVKEGLPVATNKLTMEEFTNMDDVTSINNDEVPPIMTLSNRHFRLQFNPASDPNKDVAIYTQLMYFLNVFDVTKDKADAAYATVAALIKSGREEFLTQLDSPSKIKAFLQEKFKGPGAERALDLLSGGVSMNFPLLEKKSIIALASGLESASIKTKFKGGKLILQTPEGAKEYIPGTETLRDDLSYKQEEVNGKKIMVAEVILPKSMLTDEHLEAISKGKLLYAMGDGLGYRIPSTELHSALVLKIVGTYSDTNSNVIIAPKEIVPIHGSDHDVDSLFIITRELFGDADSQLVLPSLLKDFLTLTGSVVKMLDSLKEKMDVEPLRKELVDLLHDKDVNSDEIEKDFLNSNEDRKHYAVKHGLSYNRGKWIVSNKLLYDYNRLVKLVEDSGYPIIIPDTNYTPYYDKFNTPVGYDKVNSVYVFNPNFLSDIDALISDYESIKNNVPSELKKQFLPKLSKEINKAKKVREKYLKNSLSEIMLSTINSTDPSSMMRMLSPIYFEKLRESLNDIPSNLKFNANYDLSAVEDAYRAYQSLSDGQVLTGAFANAVKVFAYLKRAGNKELTDILTRKNELQAKINLIESDVALMEQSKDILVSLKSELEEVKKQSTVARKAKSDPAFVRGEYTLNINIDGEDKILNHFVESDILNENKVTEIFDALINAAIDNLKLGLLPQMRINTLTGSSVVGQVALGMPIDLVTKILYQPVLKDLSLGLINNLTRDWVPNMKILVANNKELISNYILNEKDLDKALNSSFTDINSIQLTDPELFKIQIAVLDLFIKSHKIGEDIRNMASFMDIVRALPVFVEDIEGLDASFEAAIGKISSEGITFRNDFSLIVPNFLEKNPHIMEAYETFKSLRELIKDNFLVHSPEVESFVKRYSADNALESSEEIDNAASSLVSQKRALVAYILGELVYDNGVGTTSSKIRTFDKVKYTLSPGRVFSERVAEDLNKIKTFAAKENNTFLQNVYLYTNDSYVKSIKFGGGNGLSSNDIARITLGFNALNKYEVVDGIARHRKVTNAFEVSPFQEDLLTYAVLNYGMNFSTSNFSNYIKTSMIRNIDEKLNTRLKELAKLDGNTLSSLIGPHFYLTYIIQQWERLPFIDDSLKIALEIKTPYGKTNYIRNGVEDGIFYDRKYSNTQGGKEIMHPAFMKVNHNRGADVYIRVHKTDTATYYQKVGKSSEILFSKPHTDAFSLSEFFDPNELTIQFLYQEGNKIVASTNWNIKEGDKFWATPAYNYDRTLRKRYELVSKTVGDGTTTYVVKEVAQGIPTPPTIEIDTPTPPTSFATNYNGESLKADLTRDDATNKYMGNNTSYDSVTGIVIPAMQERPYNPEGTPGDRAADRVWSNKDPKEKVWVSEANGEVTKDEYKLLIDEKYKKGIAKGNIFHKYIHYYITRDPKTASEIQTLMVENNFTEGEFEWLTEDNNLAKIINKTGTDYLSSNNPLDKVLTEITIKSDRLKSAGTLDMLVDHGDDLYSIHDFKTGASFDRLFESSMFKYATTSTEDMWDNPRNRAKLQIMWYALMIKTENPNAKFRDLEIQYIRNKRYVDAVDNRKFINVPAYLEMIENYLKNEKSDTYKELSKLDHFKSIFNPSTYNFVDSKSMNLTSLDADIAMELKLKMLKLQGLVMWDRDLVNWKDKTDKSEKVFKEIQTTMDEIIKMQNTTGISYASWDTDMSWMESWVGSASSSTNPYVQLYYKFLQTQKNLAAKQTSDWESTFDSLLQALRKEANSKDFLGKVTRNFLGGDDSARLFGFAYTKDKSGSLRFLDDTNPDDKVEWDKLTDIQKRFLSFVLNTSDKFFVNEKSDYVDPRTGNKVALANKVITTREVKGTQKNLTNLDLFNRVGERISKSDPFIYKRGFVFKVPPLVDDIRRNNPFLSGKYLKFVWNKYFTNFFEANFDGWFATTEAIPLKFLGNAEIEENSNFSLNIEYMMKNVVKQYNYKLHLDEVYSLGTGIKYYLMAKENGDDNIDYKRAINWFEDSINLHILGRKQSDLEITRRALSVKGLEGKMLQFNFVKFMRSLKQFFAGPTMWLQPVSGFANAVFAGLVTMKEAIRNEFSIYGKHANFGVSDIAFGMKYAIDLFTRQSVDGAFRHDPMWLLMEKTRFLPDNYDWFTSSSVLLTGRNKALTSKTMYMFHSYPEEVLATATFIAQLKSMKLEDGSSVLDHYKTVDKIDSLGKSYKEVEWDGTVRGKVNISGISDKPEYKDLTELTIEEVNNLKFLYEKMHGGYRQDERIRAEYYIWGELMFQFKRYMPSILRNLFASKGVRQTQGYFKEEVDENGVKVMKWTPQIIEGRFIMLGKLILNYTGMLAGGDKNIIRQFLKMQKDEAYNWDNLSDGQKDDMRDFAVTFSMFLALMIGYFNLWDRDEDNSLKRLQLRIANDFAGNSYPFEVLQNMANLSTPVVARKSVQYATGLGELSLSIMFLGMGDEANALTKDGNLRGLTNVVRNTHILSSIYNTNRFFGEFPEEIEWNK